MKISKVHTRKLDDRSKQVIYLGKEPGTKAHRLFDPNTSCLHVSRDVRFDEKKGWDWKLQCAENRAGSDSFVIIGAQAGDQEEGTDELSLWYIHLCRLKHQVPVTLQKAAVSSLMHQVRTTKIIGIVQ